MFVQSATSLSPDHFHLPDGVQQLPAGHAGKKERRGEKKFCFAFAGNGERRLWTFFEFPVWLAFQTNFPLLSKMRAFLSPFINCRVCLSQDNFPPNLNIFFGGRGTPAWVFAFWIFPMYLFRGKKKEKSFFFCGEGEGGRKKLQCRKSREKNTPCIQKRPKIIISPENVGIYYTVDALFFFFYYRCASSKLALTLTTWRRWSSRSLIWATLTRRGESIDSRIVVM